MSRSVKYEYDLNRKKIVVLFRNGPVIEDENSFCRTHYFTDVDNTMITTSFKDELLRLFNVSGVKELKEKIDNNIKLIFKPGEGEMYYDDVSKTVFVFTKTFKEEVVKPNEKAKKLRRSMEKISKHEKVSSYEYTNMLSTLVEGVDDIEFTKKDKQIIAKAIPKLIKDGDIKISLKDVTDINKDRLLDIVKLGRDLLTKERGVEKRLGISRKFIGKEYAWQKYFEMYGSYLLFGSIEESIPESWLRINSDLRNKDSRLDLLTINRYGFLDIVELKRSDEYLFKLDESHDNIVPTSKLSTAISQVNNYLMLMPHDPENSELIKGAESATGMLVIGSDDYLMKPDVIKKYASDNNISISLVKKKIRKALRDLNYSYAHIQIVLYDELLDNLERFINQMKIEIAGDEDD
jgi:hypothetical protein